MYVEAYDWLEHSVFQSMMQGTTKGGTSAYSSVCGEPHRNFNLGLPCMRAIGLKRSDAILEGTLHEIR